MSIRVALALGVVAALGVTAVIAQQNATEVRKALMKGNNDNAGVLFRMVRGREPFDAAKVETAFAQFAETAKKLPAQFPEDSKPRPPLGEYSASLKIWENKKDFDAKAAAFGKVVADNRAKAAKNLDGLKAAFRPLGQACDNCHELYRVKQ